ncbi:MAG: PKD domain-containing protein [Candidatus Taylorbacteria bacterium]
MTSHTYTKHMAKIMGGIVFLAFFFVAVPYSHAEGRNAHRDADDRRPTPSGPHNPPPVTSPQPPVVVYVNGPDHDRDWGHNWNNYQYSSCGQCQTPIYNYSYYQQPTYIPQPVYYQQPVYIPQQTYYYQQPTYYQQPSYYQAPQYSYNSYNTQYSAPTYTGGNNSSGLSITCTPGQTDASVNQPVSWSVQVSGGAGPYTYSWSGSEGLSGSQSTVVKYYKSTGTQNAIVSISSADGRSTTQACGSTIYISGSTGGTISGNVPQAPMPQGVQLDQNGNPLGASAASAVGNTPFGWLIALIIIGLFCFVLYMLLARKAE